MKKIRKAEMEDVWERVEVGEVVLYLHKELMVFYCWACKEYILSGCMTALSPFSYHLFPESKLQQRNVLYFQSSGLSGDHQQLAFHFRANHIDVYETYRESLATLEGRWHSEAKGKFFSQFVVPMHLVYDEPFLPLQMGFQCPLCPFIGRYDSFRRHRNTAHCSCPDRAFKKIPRTPFKSFLPGVNIGIERALLGDIPCEMAAVQEGLAALGVEVRFSFPVLFPYCVPCGQYIRVEGYERFSPFYHHMRDVHFKGQPNKQECLKKLADGMMHVRLKHVKVSEDEHIRSVDWSAQTEVEAVEGVRCNLCGYCGAYKTLAAHIRKKHAYVKSIQRSLSKCRYYLPFPSYPGIPSPLRPSLEVDNAHNSDQVFCVGGVQVTFVGAVGYPYCHSCKRYFHNRSLGNPYPIVSHLKRVHQCTHEEVEAFQKACHEFLTSRSQTVEKWESERFLPVLRGYRCGSPGCGWIGSKSGLLAHSKREHKQYGALIPCRYKKPFYGYPGIAFQPAEDESRHEEISTSRELTVVK